VLCDVCNGKINTKDLNFKPEVKGGVICAQCAKLCSNHQLRTADAIRRFWNENKRRAAIFQQTEILKSTGSDVITVDCRNRLFYIGKPKTAVYYKFTEVQEFGRNKVGSQVKSKIKRDYSSVLTGYLLFGWLGALLSVGTNDDVVNSKPIPIIKLEIVLNSFYGKKIVRLKNPPKGVKEFLTKIKEEYS